jgi:Neuraminidase (sialidase)
MFQARNLARNGKVWQLANAIQVLDRRSGVIYTEISQRGTLDGHHLVKLTTLVSAFQVISKNPRQHVSEGDHI